MTTQSLQGRIETVSHSDIGRVVAIVLVIAALGLCTIEAGTAASIIQTTAFGFSTGFLVMDANGGIPSSVTERRYVWVTIIPTSIAINVIIGTVLAALGPGLTPCWFWTFSTIVSGTAVGFRIVSWRLA